MTCDVFNDQTASLELVKTVSPAGLGDPSQWNLSASAVGPLTSRDIAPVAGGTGDFRTVFAGVKYDLNESAGPASGYTNGTSWTCTAGTMSDNNTAVTLSPGQQASCEIVNVRDTSSLTVKKVFDKPADLTIPDGFEFVIPVDCTVNSFDQDVTFTKADILAGTLTKQINNVPTGTVCTFSETTPAGITGWTWGTPTFDPASKSVTIVKTPTASQNLAKVTNTITRDTSSLTVKKVFDKPADLTIPDGFEFVIPVDCTVNSFDQDVTFTKADILAGTLTKQINNVPTGTVCTFSETTPAGITGWTWGTPTFDPASKSVTIVKTPTASQNLAKVTNTITRDTSSLTVKKVFDKPADLTIPDGFEFVIPVDCTVNSFDQDVTFTKADILAGTLTKQINNVPTGTVCTFSETTPAGITGWTWGTPTFDPASKSVTIVKTPTASQNLAKVTNTITRDTSSLTVKKVFDKPADLTIPDGFEFVIPVDCTVNSFDQDVTFTKADILAGTLTKQINNVPTGTVCTFSETTPAGITGWTWGTPTFDPASKSVTIVKTPTASQNLAKVTNTITRDTSSLTVKKVFDKPADLTIPDGFEFVIPVDCTVNSFDQDVTFTKADILAGTLTKQINNVPTGTVCTFSETTPAGITGWTWGTPTFDPASKSVTIVKTPTASQNLAKVTNTITRDTSSLTVKKVFDKPADLTIPDGFEFVIPVDCTVNSFDQDVTFTKADILAGTLTKQINNVPTGTVCTFSETTPAGITGWTWGTPTFDPASKSVTIVKTPTASQNLAKVTNTITRDTSSLTVKKVFDKPADLTIPDGFEFVIPVDCTVNSFDQDVTFTKADILAGTLTKQINNVPTGTVCTFSETTPAGITGWTWGTPTFDPASKSVTIVKTPTASQNLAKVTNTITRDTSSLTVKKVFDKPADLTIPDGFEFVIPVDCTVNSFDQDVTFTKADILAGTLTKQINNVPTGTVCTFSETTPAGITGWTWGNPHVRPGRRP